jgi:hypothetical protein
MSYLVFAAQILLGVIAFSIIGSVLSGKSPLKNLAYNCLIGQVIASAYFYIRSGFSEYIFNFPVSIVETWAYIFCLYFLLIWKKKWDKWSYRYINWIDVGVIFILALLLAYFELPKLQMLSSDPDQHLFFASQIEFFGKIPYRRDQWGGLPFNYPSGTGVLIYLWSTFTFLDPRNTVTVLPLVETFLAPIAIINFMYGRKEKYGEYIFIALCLIAITFIGFNFPFLGNYFHQEGFGRLVSIGFVSLISLLIIDLIGNSSNSKNFSLAISIGLTLFFLFVLNPINIVVPIILISSIFLTHAAIGNKRIWVLSLSLSFLLLALLDPYYLNLITGSVKQSGAQISLPSFNIGLLNSEFLINVFKNLANKEFILVFCGFLVNSHMGYLFLLIYVPLLLLPLPPKKSSPFLVAVLISLVVLLLCASAFFLLRAYSPFYILYPYLIQSISQYKVVLYQVLFALGAACAINRSGISFGLVIKLLICFLAIYFVMNLIGGRDYRIRKHYCGSLGCVSNSDIHVLKQFQLYKRSVDPKDEVLPDKILIPNILISGGGENWIFPFGGSRIVPLFNIAPLAFYYFQGSVEYSVESYNKNVCQNFNLDWLRGLKIRYLFLPSDRGPICIHDIDKVARESETLFRDGESILLKLY